MYRRLSTRFSHPVTWFLALSLVLAACAQGEPVSPKWTMPDNFCRDDEECNLCFCGQPPPLGECIPEDDALTRPDCSNCQISPQWCGCKDNACTRFGLAPPTLEQVNAASTDQVASTNPSSSPSSSQTPPVQQTSEPPNACDTDSHCIASTIGTNPVLKETAEYGTLGGGSNPLKILVACANKKFVIEHGTDQLLRTATADFDMRPPSPCVCAQELCKFS